MTNPVVLSFDADGNVEYTRNTMFQPFDGRGEMQRVTDIKKRKDCNLYFIHWMLGPFAGQDHTYLMDHEYGVHSGPPVIITSLTVVVLFDSYEAAVTHEVKMLNAMRKAGVLFNGSTSTPQD